MDESDLNLLWELINANLCSPPGAEKRVLFPPCLPLALVALMMIDDDDDEDDDMMMMMMILSAAGICPLADQLRRIQYDRSAYA